jgi:hypothetical protein
MKDKIGACKQRSAAPDKRTVGRPFLPGVSGNPLCRRLLSKRAQQLADEMSADFGGFDKLRGVQQVMMRRAATLFARSETANNPDDAVRLTNCACRVSRQPPERPPQAHADIARRASRADRC